MRTSIFRSTLLGWGGLDRLELLWLGMEFPGIWMKEHVWPAKEAQLSDGTLGGGS